MTPNPAVKRTVTGKSLPAACVERIVNTSAAPLKYLSISTRESPEVVEYPDSGKYLASAAHDGDAHGFARMHRAESDLDYWDGEA